MMKKNKLWIKTFILLNVIIMFTGSCKKDNSDTGNPYNGKSTALFSTSKTYGTLTDVDGNEYKTIVIGTQTWMAENLRTTKFHNGDLIPEVKDNTAWANLTSGAYCNYYNTQKSDSIATFGRLYNGLILSDSRNLAPTGWHVATDAEWSALMTYLGEFAANKLKESGTFHWQMPNASADNGSGFTALPAGFRRENGTFGQSEDCFWWSSTASGQYDFWFWYMYSSQTLVHRSNVDENGGYSVRCVKD
jgi:uncharacterized protein (TIGR02145 family)